MRLALVHTYPVKSCHRIEHDQPVRVQPWGLAGDRRWLVVDPAGKFVTQRELPAMARVRPRPRPDGGVTLSAPRTPDLEQPPPEPTQLVDVKVHQSVVAATPAGSMANGWLSAVLGRELRLVWLDDPTRRAVNPEFGLPTDRVGFADAYPLLLANLASLRDLNDRLAADGSDEGPLPITRFRPNVAVEGAAPWAEDAWLGRRVRIGLATFRVVKPCDRCVVTTTDQETGVRGREPLRALARHRRVGKKVLFGMNLIPDPPYQSIVAGDPVEILD